MRSRRRTSALPYLFVAPTVGLTVAFSLVPLGMLGYRSLQHGGVFGNSLRFVGLRNYREMLAEGGGHALRVTAVYTTGFVVLTMLAGITVALLLNSRTPGVRRLRAPFIVPLVVPAVATALIWGNLFAPRFGLVNRLLSAAGLPEADFLSAPGPALAMVVLFGTWQFFGQNVILYLAALKALPVDVVEAAAVDGAGAWARFRHVQWPMLRRNTLLILVVTTLTGLQTFTQIYVLTSGGPSGATQTALYYVYDQGFRKFDTGRADAMGMVLFLLSLAVTLLQIVMLGRRERHA
ncbi:carbohydrate ABC transporter permease [Actinomadura macrotermitis]|uniref:sn-glycerol-3-phosphate transport system permease protein UgpA n=1 Tax=Actinomadura macrotermitis TaxID=2585200 RepID=A0A7K0C981_9ACTN|nr:sugar ABC transporter permease [Actinomadura macrotermitis]MQY09344.1 sn-glycerol-3-phosphate transport system permease protein UgpA [Actinomadura macrotermitis]